MPFPAEDLTTGNLFSRIAGRLACKIIQRVMYDHCPADYLPHPESVGQKHRKRITARSKQRHKIPRMVGMRTALRIVMAANVKKRIAFVARARSALVNMKRKYGILARSARNRKPCQFCCHQNAKCRFVKTDNPRNVGIFCTSLYHSPPLRMVLKQSTKRQKQRISDQKNTPFLCFISSILFGAFHIANKKLSQPLTGVTVFILIIDLPNQDPAHKADAKVQDSLFQCRHMPRQTHHYTTGRQRHHPFPQKT